MEEQQSGKLEMKEENPAPICSFHKDEDIKPINLSVSAEKFGYFDENELPYWGFNQHKGAQAYREYPPLPRVKAFESQAIVDLMLAYYCNRDELIDLENALSVPHAYASEKEEKINRRWDFLDNINFRYLTTNRPISYDEMSLKEQIFLSIPGGCYVVFDGGGTYVELLKSYKISVASSRADTIWRNINNVSALGFSKGTLSFDELCSREETSKVNWVWYPGPPPQVNLSGIPTAELYTVEACNLRLSYESELGAKEPVLFIRDRNGRIFFNDVLPRLTQFRIGRIIYKIQENGNFVISRNKGATFDWYPLKGRSQQNCRAYSLIVTSQGLVYIATTEGIFVSQASH